MKTNFIRKAHSYLGVATLLTDPQTKVQYVLMAPDVAALSHLLTGLSEDGEGKFDPDKFHPVELFGRSLTKKG